MHAMYTLYTHYTHTGRDDRHTTCYLSVLHKQHLDWNDNLVLSHQKPLVVVIHCNIGVLVDMKAMVRGWTERS